jgi:hypothetical protein
MISNSANVGYEEDDQWWRLPGESDLIMISNTKLIIAMELACITTPMKIHTSEVKQTNQPI